MKMIPALFILMISLVATAQSPVQQEYEKGIYAIARENFSEAYETLKKAHEAGDKNDTLYDDILWFYIVSLANLENQSAMKEDWKQSLQYAFEAMKAIEEGKQVFGESFAEREYWMIKNIIVAGFGTGNLRLAQTYREKLYLAYRDKKLPDGLDQYFNFEYFTWEGLNIWGYEWYAKSGDPETQENFSKIVYFIYKAGADGSDENQLYRIHVTHRPDSNTGYTLVKITGTIDAEKSETLSQYTYPEKINYKKLRSDVRRVIKAQPVPAPGPAE